MEIKTSLKSLITKENDVPLPVTFAAKKTLYNKEVST